MISTPVQFRSTRPRTRLQEQRTPGPQDPVYLFGSDQPTTATGGLQTIQDRLNRTLGLAVSGKTLSPFEAAQAGAEHYARGAPFLNSESFETAVQDAMTRPLVSVDDAKAAAENLANPMLIVGRGRAGPMTIGRLREDSLGEKVQNAIDMVADNPETDRLRGEIQKGLDSINSAVRGGGAAFPVGTGEPTPTDINPAMMQILQQLLQLMTVNTFLPAMMQPQPLRFGSAQTTRLGRNLL